MRIEIYIFETKSDLIELVHFLSRSEREYLLNLSSQNRRLQFVSGRLAVRSLLKLNSARNIYKDENGKPYIPNESHFNIAHSGRYVAIAVSQDIPVGVDILHMRLLEKNSVLPHTTALSDAEYEWLRKLDGDEVNRALIQLWVRKESVLKAHGIGMRYSTRNLNVQAVEKITRKDLYDCTNNIDTKSLHTYKILNSSLSIGKKNTWSDTGSSSLHTDWVIQDLFTDSKDYSVAVSFPVNNNDLQINVNFWSPIGEGDLLSLSQHVTIP